MGAAFLSRTEKKNSATDSIRFKSKFKINPKDKNVEEFGGRVLRVFYFFFRRGAGEISPWKLQRLLQKKIRKIFTVV